VQAGNKVELDAWVRYKAKPTYHRHMTPLLMGQLLSGTYAGLGVFEGYTASQAAPLFEALASAMQGTGEEDDRPFAYLNFALFAHDMSLLDAGWERIPEEAGFASGEESLPNRHKRVAFAVPVVVPEDGFIYIWLSNESEGTEVWFDDLSIRHTQTLVAQATDYGVWGEVLREQRSDSRKYRYGYQSLSRLSGRQFAEKDEESGWNHFELRQYDAVIGRWLSVDPYRQYHSPYVGMGNNPVNRVDPDGGYSKFGAWWRNGFTMQNTEQGKDGEWAIIRTRAGITPNGNLWSEFFYDTGKSKESNKEWNRVQLRTNGPMFPGSEIGSPPQPGDVVLTVEDFSLNTFGHKNFVNSRGNTVSVNQFKTVLEYFSDGMQAGEQIRDRIGPDNVDHAVDVSVEYLIELYEKAGNYILGKGSNNPRTINATMDTMRNLRTNKLYIPKMNPDGSFLWTPIKNDN
jgi:RHS repeat-associated protein